MAPKAKQTSWSTPALQDKELRMSYRIARGEQGVLTFEPYKTMLLAHWRFKDRAAAVESSKILRSAFDFFLEQNDFVGADMARKFIQMGMTRAKRYANHSGGRKYKKGTREVLEKGEETADMKEKLKASNVFRKVWLDCREQGEYQRLRDEFVKEQTDWDHQQRPTKDSSKHEDTDS